MIVIPDYRGHRIEVAAVADGQRWNAEIRIIRPATTQPHIETMACHRLSPELAERAGEGLAKRLVDVTLLAERPPGDGFTVGHDIAEPAVHQFLAARSYYVLARVAIWSGAHSAADVLLSQQCIEFYIKAIRRQRSDTAFPQHGPAGHDLVRLIRNTPEPRPPYFDAVLAERAKTGFLTLLSEASSYLAVRYRNKGYGINFRDATTHLDGLAFNLDTTFRDLQPEVGRKLYVAKQLQQFVLEGNRFFTEQDITDDWLAAGGNAD
jgi:hypothetical protein